MWRLAILLLLLTACGGAPNPAAVVPTSLPTSEPPTPTDRPEVRTAFALATQIAHPTSTAEPSPIAEKWSDKINGIWRSDELHTTWTFDLDRGELTTDLDDKASSISVDHEDGKTVYMKGGSVIHFISNDVMRLQSKDGKPITFTRQH